MGIFSGLFDTDKAVEDTNNSSINGGKAHSSENKWDRQNKDYDKKEKEHYFKTKS